MSFEDLPSARHVLAALNEVIEGKRVGGPRRANAKNFCGSMNTPPDDAVRRVSHGRLALRLIPYGLGRRARAIDQSPTYRNSPEPAHG